MLFWWVLLNFALFFLQIVRDCIIFQIAANYSYIMPPIILLLNCYIPYSSWAKKIIGLNLCTAKFALDFSIFIKWKIYLRKIFNLILAPSVCTRKANCQIRYSNKKLLHVYETMWGFQPQKNSNFLFLIIGQVRRPKY